MEHLSYMTHQFMKPVCVVSPLFMLQFPVDLMVVKKLLSLTDGNLCVTDINGNLVFKVKEKLLSIRDKYVLVDGVGNRILTIQKKLVSARGRWQCFRGDSTEPKELLFTARQSNLIQLQPSLDVFLPHNTREDVCDFKVKGSWFDKCFTVYARESTTIIAQMRKSFAFGKDAFSVTVYPNVDYAFVVALAVILNDEN